MPGFNSVSGINVREGANKRSEYYAFPYFACLGHLEVHTKGPWIVRVSPFSLVSLVSSRTVLTRFRSRRSTAIRSTTRNAPHTFWTAQRQLARAFPFIKKSTMTL